ncbi:ropporin-1-like protein [Argopecten irradians]|uniref:ropporin-1-like protein n=1 Tax=Argopecten irradians TaxID=31199 RepID=UPI0037185B28
MPSNPDEPYYCSQQINIPPSLPDILKQFTKAAIRTQPNDVLAWSAAYFRAMSKGETPPVKERLEMPVATQKTDTGLTPGLLRVLNKQLGPKKTVPLSMVEEKWQDVALPKEQFDEIARIGSFGGDVEWNKFFTLACSALGENLTDAMKLVCEILTADPEGGPARIPFPLFKELYTYLAQIDGDISQGHIDDTLNTLKYDVEKQDGYIQPRNFLSPEGPKLSMPTSS